MPEQTASMDEMVDGFGGIRPHWRALLANLSTLEWTDLGERAHRLEAAAEEEGAAPSWRLDPIPLPLPAAEFATLEAGLVQRARLLEALLADIYGSQDLLTEGAVPPALLHANPAYLRPGRTRLPEGPHRPLRLLHAYAADLERGPDGHWRVRADRTGGLLGIGYARESRRLLARVLPELFRGGQVRPLRPFFEAWSDALLRLQQPANRAPLVALLTGGAADPHWPEHLAVSRDLACALVEARDLTARNGTLAIKTLQGLHTVDVLLRRVPGDQLDPLELDTGAGGIAGLLDAARSGAVQLVNDPGAAVIEAPAFAAFMPALCRRLLGEPLLLPTQPTLWLGDPAARRTVGQATGQSAGRWLVCPALDGSAPPVPLAGLSPEARAALQASIAERPWAYAGRTAAAPSLAPCFERSGMSALPVMLRMFLVHDGTGWRMLDGGLARVLRPGEHPSEQLPVGAVLKDLWVMREEGGTVRSSDPVPQPPVAVRRTSGNLPSRVADDFFWLGRYIERLETQARVARATLLRRARGTPGVRESAEIAVLVRCLRSAGMPDSEAATPEGQVRAAFAPGGAVAGGLAHIARLVSALRDRLTVETHAAFAHALRTARADVAAAEQAGIDGLVHALAGLQRLATTVAGVAADGMVRGGGRLFLDLGRRMERANVGAYILAGVLDQPPARMEATLRLVLELCDSIITYRNRYPGVLQPAPVLDLVLADTANPRALSFQFEAAAGLLQEAGEPELADSALAVQARVEAMIDGLVSAPDQATAAARLPNELIGAGNDAAALSDRITRRFFAVLPRLRSVGLEVA